MHEVAPRDFAVATVDHGLRRESADEAVMVARLCASLGITHRTITLALAPGSAVQERARAARYGALGDWLRTEGLAALVTAHHADDQAETMVMRLNRGAGLKGLGAMRPRAAVPGHPDLPLLRPLLGWRRRELAEVVAAAGITAADDPSNRDVRFERVRVRGGMTSSLWIDSSGIARSAAHLAEADAALDWAAAKAFEGVLTLDIGLAWDRPPDLPRTIALRVLGHILARLGAAPPRGRDLARWLDALDGGQATTLAGVKGDARRRPWRFMPAPPHRSGP